MGQLGLPLPVSFPLRSVYQRGLLRRLLSTLAFFLLLASILHRRTRNTYYLYPRYAIIVPQIIPYTHESTPSTPIPHLSLPFASPAYPRFIPAFLLPSPPTHIVPVFPRQVVVPDNAPRAEEILFAVTTTPGRAEEFSALWAHWVRDGARCLVVLPPHAEGEKDQAEEVRIMLRRKRGLECLVWSSEVDHYETRVLSMPREAVRAAREIGAEVKWLVIGDDDTVFFDLRAVRRMLAKYDPSRTFLVGGITEAEAQFGAFGPQAFGGGGIFLSSALMRLMSEAYLACLDNARDVRGGDGKLTHCAALAMDRGWEEALSVERGLHQFDVPGNSVGFLQSGLSFVSGHHFIDSWSDIIPKHFPPHLSSDISALHALLKSAEFLGADNLLRRLTWEGEGGKGGTVLGVLGHSVTRFGSVVEDEDWERVEYTWSYENYTLAQPYYPATRPQRKDRREEYYIRDVVLSAEQEGEATFWFEDRWGGRLGVIWREEG